MPAASPTPNDAFGLRIQPLVLADQARHLQHGDPLYLLGNAGLAVMTALVVRDSAPLPWLLAWLAVTLLTTAGHGWMTWRQRGRTDRPARQLRYVTHMSAVSGLLWAAGVLLVYPGADDLHRALLIVLLGGMATSAKFSLAVHLPALCALYVPMVAGVVIAALGNGGPARWVVVILAPLWLACAWPTAASASRGRSGPRCFRSSCTCTTPSVTATRAWAWAWPSCSACARCWRCRCSCAHGRAGARCSRCVCRWPARPCRLRRSTARARRQVCPPACPRWRPGMWCWWLTMPPRSAWPWARCRIGIDAVCLKDGRVALQEIDLHRPDAIVLELMMPAFDGFQVLDAWQRLSAPCSAWQGCRSPSTPCRPVARGREFGIPEQSGLKYGLAIPTR